jgi:xanthine dehydrogenase YagR molybdenum-binding subunit
MKADISHMASAPVLRVDGREKVTGTAKYAAEFAAPGMAHAVLVQSSIASGRILELDTSGKGNS